MFLSVVISRLQRTGGVAGALRVTAPRHGIATELRNDFRGRREPGRRPEVLRQRRWTRT